MAAYIFLRINGFTLSASEVEAVAMISDLAAGEINEDELSTWIESNSLPIEN